MIEGYFDESGIHDGAPVCLVGGYYGTQAAWRKFEVQWNAILADYPELASKGFHAKVFFARDKGNRVQEYSGWSDDKARRFLDRLVQCIIRNRIFPIGYGVIVADFLDLSLHLRQWLTGARFNKLDGSAETEGCPDKAYYVPFQFCVLKSAKISNANSTDKIHFFVGTDRTLHDYASALFDYVLIDDRLDESLRSKLGTLVNPRAKDTPGLQAADLLVYRMYRASLRIGLRLLNQILRPY